MASSSFSDAPVPENLEADAKSVTIVINDNGEINYDEKTLQSIIGEFLLFYLEYRLFVIEFSRISYKLTSDVF